MRAASADEAAGFSRWASRQCLEGVSLTTRFGFDARLTPLIVLDLTEFWVLPLMPPCNCQVKLGMARTTLALHDFDEQLAFCHVAPKRRTSERKVGNVGFTKSVVQDVHKALSLEMANWLHTFALPEEIEH